MWGFYWLVIGHFYVTVNDAYTDGHIVTVTPQTLGTVTEINVDDSMPVKAGDVLVRLDPTEAKIGYQRATANLATTVRSVEQAYAALRQAIADVDMRKMQLVQAKRDAERAEGMFRAKAMSLEGYQHAKTNYFVAMAMLKDAEAILTDRKVAVADTTIMTHPSVLQAEADLRNAYLTLQHMTIRAPISGYVAKRSVQLGMKITAGTPLMAIVTPNQIWVTANFKENELARLRVGQPVTIKSDVYGNGVIYHGIITGFSAGTGNVFSLLPPENATGNWIKIVQRLPVRIRLDAKELVEHPLSLGLSMTVTVDTHDLSGTPLSGSKIKVESPKTTIFDLNQKAELEPYIQMIIAKNRVG